MLDLRMKRRKENPTYPLWRSKGMDLEEATAKDVFNWWLEYDILPGQMNWFEDFEETEEE